MACWQRFYVCRCQSDSDRGALILDSRRCIFGGRLPFTFGMSAYAAKSWAITMHFVSAAEKERWGGLQAEVWRGAIHPGIDLCQPLPVVGHGRVLRPHVMVFSVVSPRKLLITLFFDNCRTCAVSRQEINLIFYLVTWLRSEGRTSPEADIGLSAVRS